MIRRAAWRPPEKVRPVPNCETRKSCCQALTGQSTVVLLVPGTCGAWLVLLFAVRLKSCVSLSKARGPSACACASASARVRTSVSSSLRRIGSFFFESI